MSIAATHLLRAVIPMVLLALVLSSTTYQRNRIYQDEVTLWRDAVRMPSVKQRAYHNYGCALAEAGRYEEALRAFDAALALEQDGTVLEHFLYLERGNSYYRLGRFDEALGEWKHALATSPGNPEIMTNIAVVLLAQHRTAEALSYARSALMASEPLAETLEVMGEIALQQGDKDGAFSYFLKAIVKKPSLVSANQNALLALKGVRSPRRARQLVQEQLAKYPSRQDLSALSLQIPNDRGR